MTAIALLLALAALLAWALWANKALVLTEYTAAPEGLPQAFGGFKIAQVSDLHNAAFGEDNGKLLSLLREADPDIIAVTGDLVDSRRTDVDSAAAFIEAAAEIAPVYYVTGNHEARLDFADIERRLLDAGAAVLRGEAAYIERGGERIRLAGIDDPAFAGADGSAAERAARSLEGLMEGESCSILLAHRPELVRTYAGYGADLVLSGHAHGGQIRLPLLGGLFAPGQGFLPEYDAGLYEADGTLLVVSRGLGNSAFPLRVNNRPELVLITLSAEK